MAEEESYVAPHASEVIAESAKQESIPIPRAPPPLPPFPISVSPARPAQEKLPETFPVETNAVVEEEITNKMKVASKAKQTHLGSEEVMSLSQSQSESVAPVGRDRRVSIALNEQIMINVATRGIHPEEFPEYVGMGLVDMTGDHFALDSESESDEEPEGKVQIDPKDRWKKAVRKLTVIRTVSNTKEQHENAEVARRLEEKRQHARSELLASEREYYNRLSVLCDCFMTPLINFVEGEFHRLEKESEGADAGPLLVIDESHVAQVRAVFGNIAQIREMTKQLLEELTPAIEGDGKVGPVFVKMAPFFRMYLSYYQTFDESRLALNDLKNHSWFHCFLAGCESQPSCHNRRLRDFLIEPVQRVPRYELLIKEIIRYTPPGHPFSEELTSALADVKKVADSMNFELRSSDLRLKVASLSVEWQGVDFTAAHRTFIREGDLIKTNRRGTKVKYRFLLFNDLLAFGMERSANRFRLHFKAPLRDCLLVDSNHVYSKLGSMPLHDEHAPRPKTMLDQAMMLANAPTRGGATAAAWKLLLSNGLSMERVLESQIDGHSFIVQAPSHKTLFLTATNTEEQKAWVNAISSAVLEQTTDAKEHKGRRLSMLPTPKAEIECRNVSNKSWW